MVALVWLPLRMLDDEQSVQEKLANIDLPSYGGVVAHSYLPSNWLSALGLFAYTRYDESQDQSTLFDPGKHFTYVPPTDIDDTYVVFIIGETTRWDHMGMLGYERDTTPRLSKEKNLVAFRGESCDTATAVAALHVRARRRHRGQPAAHAERAKRVRGDEGTGLLFRAVRHAE